MTVIIVLLAMFMLGGTANKHFVLTLIIGIFFGTYSSIFNASPLLVVYNNYKIKKAKQTSLSANSKQKNKPKLK